MYKFIDKCLDKIIRLECYGSRAIIELQKPVVQMSLIGGTTVFFGATSYLLSFDEEIEVKNKYVKIEGPRSLYMITSSKGKIYKFDKATWKFHWRQAELWNSVEKGQHCRVKGFGIRWPFFGIYPNIHSIKNIKN